MGEIPADCTVRPYVHLIAGPTGAGKSAVANDLARVTGAPVVVADRLQCFTDLATTSARAGAQAPGVRRYWLADRTVADGDLDAAAAADSLFGLVERLGSRHPFVIVEGGSISLLKVLAARCAALPWQLSVRVLPLPAYGDYIEALTCRARTMLAPPTPERSLLEELAVLWADPRHRRFAASVNGFEAVLECCAKYSLNVGTIHKQAPPDPIRSQMASLIALRHAEHGILQSRVFTETFGSRLPEQILDPSVLGRAA
ncbi:isopentenyl transferase family protein [Streptomyces turgidiscabies]|uniref:Isopentenyl transferase n=1 Tax=Streptomyces turgidiscabies (strain Car8) TaxID=698760 RepID=L7FIQ5_STRT8|nr:MULTISPECIES: isopentenyl transferase family protein [Streptomyces]ELP70971.1 isopentenyl transferase [Streptomyces turgidiscabies Car8]MDX3491875.1 isopentenyl transferase family protein [Streptomyces turgidiscabies]GAQ72008.1 adenylate dimethylallyltransferase [Streptomyces turgidiscabies]